MEEYECPHLYDGRCYAYDDLMREKFRTKCKTHAPEDIVEFGELE